MLYGDGTTLRDYTYIDDIIDGVIRAIERPQGYAVINLGQSRPVELRRMVAVLEEALGKRAQIQYEPMQPGDVERTFADTSRAEALLGYRPRTPLEAGIAKYVAWLRTRQAAR